MRANKSIWFLFFILLASCGGDLTSEEYLVWSETNLNKQRAVGDVKLEAMYQSPDYRMIKGLATDGMTYMNMKLSAVNEKLGLFDLFAKAGMGKQEAIYYLSFKLQKDIFLEANGKQLPCINYHYERTHGMAGSAAVMLVFDTSGLASIEEMKLVVHPSPLRTGPIKLYFDLRDLAQLKKEPKS